MSDDYSAGARNAVRACLGIGGGDRVAIIEDRGRADIARAIGREAEDAGAEVRSWVMEDVVERPATEFPAALAEEITGFRPTASFYVGEGMPGELAFRHPMRELLVGRLRCRHGHMIGISPEVMRDGMAGDYDEIYRTTRRVYDVVREARTIEVRSPLGTDLRATFDPGWRWVSSDGRYRDPGQWGNLPEGEVFTAPKNVEGVLVGEEIGDHFAPRYGLLEAPVRLHLTAGRVTRVECDDAALAAELEAYLGQHPESNRAGEFAIGTNLGLTRVIGNFLQDEKFPGVHVAFGDPYGPETGADWEAPSHVDVLATRTDVSVDGRPIMRAGRFLL
jgi:leucyl aminopeptidase (aminopeptidase T)